MPDGTVGVKQSATPDRLVDNEVLNVAGQDVYRQRVTIGAVTGTWAYRAGTAGSVTVGAGQRVIGIAAHSTTGGSFTVNGGDSIPVPASSGIAITPLGNLVAPTIMFTDTDSFFVEAVT